MSKRVESVYVLLSEQYTRKGVAMPHHHSHDHSHGSHGHHHDYSVETEQDRKRLRRCMWANGVYGAFQLIIGLLMGSMLLLTDAFHNISDIASIGMPLIALALASRPYSAQWTSGLKRGTILAAFTNFAVLNLFMLWAILESALRILKPESAAGALATAVPVPFAGFEVNPGVIMACMAAIGIGVNLYSVNILSKDKEHDLNMKSAFSHQLTDLISSVVAVIAGIAVMLSGQGLVDPMLTIAVSAFLLRMIWPDTKQSWRLLNGATPANISTENIVSFLRGLADVADVHALSFTPTSTTETDMSVHLVINRPWGDSYTELLQAVRHEMIDHHHISNVSVQLEHLGAPCRHFGHLYGRA